MATSVDATTEVKDHYVFLQLLHDVLQPEAYLESGVESAEAYIYIATVSSGLPQLTQ
jgi:hypothetical protein